MTINIETPMVPPQWALLERQLLKVQSDACAAFLSTTLTSVDISCAYHAGAVTMARMTRLRMC